MFLIKIGFQTDSGVQMGRLESHLPPEKIPGSLIKGLGILYICSATNPSGID
jgi:hypothetical protein